MQKKVMKIIVLFFICVLFLFGCTKTEIINTPNNFKIDGTIASWNNVDCAIKYRLNFEKAGVTLKRIVEECSVDLNSLDLETGSYIVNVQAIGNESESAFTTDNLEYYQSDKNIVNELKEDKLLDSLYVKWNGRTLYNSEMKLNMVCHSASGFEVKFVGTKVETRLYATNYNDATKRPYVVIVIDDNFDNMERIALTQKYTDLVLVDNVSDGIEHKVTLYKSTESIDSHIGVESITTDGKLISGIDIKERKIEFIAASSSTGYGNLAAKPTEQKTSANSDCMQGFAAITARKLDADFQIFSASGWGVKASLYANKGENLFDAYKNYDFRGEAKNVAYSFNLFTPDVIVVNLGTNDYSYANEEGISDSEKVQRLNEFKEQYMAFIEYIRAIYPNAHIVLFYGLMNENKAIIEATEEMYNILLPKVKNISNIKVSGDAQGSSYHPSVASHKSVANKLVEHIKKQMGW